MSYSLAPSDRAALFEEREQYRRMRHWCSECRGFTQGNSPCAPDDETEDEEQEE